MADAGHMLMLLRHGIAEDAAPGEADAERRLTGEGKRKLREVAAGMRALKLPVDVILTSPLRRARETAEIVAVEHGIDESAVFTTAALAPAGDRDALFTLLGSHTRAEGIVLVGHQPDLGELASVLLVGTPGLVQYQAGSGLPTGNADRTVETWFKTGSTASQGASDADYLRRALEQRLATRVDQVDPRQAASLTDRITANPELLDALAPLVGLIAREKAA